MYFTILPKIYWLYRLAIDMEIKTGQIYIITYADNMPAAQKF
jgi:hypothetical protein